ncbi:hypothetical protein A3842_07155 [Paenibacillus sp. P3E]|uniref:hypothetical protein n=1 Tax=Paenibacillus sp. P3E TaxID=1349435 RepID=UPI0009391FF0|nr:hypothetical protein [Paenibacillus sp. P3E]OKP85954.1 hypothetical protein A3842_07155 [Paenibacillus sp. P3E]
MREFSFKRRLEHVPNFQEDLSRKLSIVFDSEFIKTEWSAELDNGVYSPRLDLAVGPFAIEESYESLYNEMVYEPTIFHFLSRLQEAHAQNLERNSHMHTPELERKLFMNPNARCLLSIEIENAVSQKHMLGAIVNASALGRLGILIPWNERKLRAFIRALNYLGFLKSVGKNNFDMTNIFIVTKEQIESALLGISVVNRISN